MARARNSNKGGSKGKYREWLTEEGLLKVRGWALDGLIDEQIAHNMGISRSTLSEWKNRFPDFADALKKGKEVIDRQVENALLKRALGYRYDEVTRERNEEDGNMYVTKIVTKEVQPDVTAQIFWLKNRKVEVWRDSALQQLQAEKLKAETDFVKMRAELVKGVKKDTSLMDALIKAVSEE